MKNILSFFSGSIDQIQQRKKQPTKSAKTVKKEDKHFHIPRIAPKKMVVDVPFSVLVKILLAYAGFVALSQIMIEIQNVLVTFGVTLFLAMGLSPIVKQLEQYVPRPIAILILYVIFLGALSALFVMVIPIMAREILQIANDLTNTYSSQIFETEWLAYFVERFNFDIKGIESFIAENLTSISTNLQNIAGSALDIFSGIFQGVFNFFFALVVLFFILMEREMIGNFVLMLFARNQRKYMKEKSLSIQHKLAEWFKAQFILMLSIGISMYIGLSILEYTLGMEYAMTLAVLAGFMELFPYIGVIITGILASLVAINISWQLLLAVVIWIFIIQFLEGNFLVPLIMEKVVGLPSVVTILALVIGGILGNALGGVAMSIVGMIFSIPVTASIAIFVEEFTRKEREHDHDLQQSLFVADPHHKKDDE